MNKSELIKEVAKETHLPASAVKEVLETTMNLIEETTKAGHKVTLRFFGSFIPKEVPAQTYRNPQTGEPVAKPAYKTVRFKTGSRMKFK